MTREGDNISRVFIDHLYIDTSNNLCAYGTSRMKLSREQEKSYWDWIDGEKDEDMRNEGNVFSMTYILV